jgi:leucyl aminopeptidase
MKFTLFSEPATALADLPVDLLAVALFKENRNESELFSLLNQRLDGHLGRIAEEERFLGKPQQTLTVHTHGKIAAPRILLVGLGSRADATVADVRHAAAKVARAARHVGAKSAAIAFPAGRGDARDVELAVEGVLLGRYKFDRYLTSDESKHPDVLESVTLAASRELDAGAFEKSTRRAEIVAEAAARARDLVNEPAAEMTPTKLAAVAEELARARGLDVEILDAARCRELGMGMFLAVAQGSDEEPRFIHLSYKPKSPAKKKVVIIGKAVTFDSGGLSLKTSQGMEDMKVDMAGSAAVIQAIGALAALEAPVEVHALAAATENMPSGKSYKLGDVLKSMAGKTVEINNTDAEGRLTLGDALAFAKTLEPDEIFDFATLTGACMVALGPHIAGVMSNDAALSERWLAAAKAAGEEMWPMPLPDRLKEQLKSDIADMRNTGERYGGALTAGLFLKEFAGTTPWVHVDIAGPATEGKEYGAHTKGGTGFAVATIVEYLTRA